MAVFCASGAHVPKRTLRSGSRNPPFAGRPDANLNTPYSISFRRFAWRGWLGMGAKSESFSDVLRPSLQQVEGPIGLAQQRVNAGDIVPGVVVVRIDRQGAIRPFLGSVAFAKRRERASAKLRAHARRAIGGFADLPTSALAGCGFDASLEARHNWQKSRRERQAAREFLFHRRARPMSDRTDRLAEARALYARMMAAESGSSDPRR